MNLRGALENMKNFKNKIDHNLMHLVKKSLDKICLKVSSNFANEVNTPPNYINNKTVLIYPD